MQLELYVLPLQNSAPLLASGPMHRLCHEIRFACFYEKINLPEKRIFILKIYCFLFQICYYYFSFTVILEKHTAGAKAVLRLPGSKLEKARQSVEDQQSTTVRVRRAR